MDFDKAFVTLQMSQLFFVLEKGDKKNQNKVVR